MQAGDWLVAVLLVAGTWAWWEAEGPVRAENPPAEGAGAAADSKEPAAPEDAPKLPPGWPAGHPVPRVATNCRNCHLLAGRELTLAVRDFSRSVHDLHDLSCNDCHGGNLHDDAAAHEEDPSFIGTKLSAHIQACADCHDEQATVLAAGPHHWDFSQRINTKFPHCIDCHGNHDVGNPPPDFSLRAVCEDCHHDFDQEMPGYAAVVDQNDKFWKTLMQVRTKNLHEPAPVPEPFQEEVDALRAATMKLMHGVGKLSGEEAQQLNERVERLRTALEKWLESAGGEPAAGAR